MCLVHYRQILYLPVTPQKPDFLPKCVSEKHQVVWQNMPWGWKNLTLSDVVTTRQVAGEHLGVCDKSTSKKVDFN